MRPGQRRGLGHVGLPHDTDESGVSNVTVSRQQWEIEVTGHRADERVERIVVWTRLVGDIDLLGRQVDRLIRGIAEEIGEEFSHRPLQVDTAQVR